VTTLLMSNSGHIIEMLVFWKLGNTLACHAVLTFFPHICASYAQFSHALCFTKSRITLKPKTASLIVLLSPFCFISKAAGIEG
jgi:hypothetical protein